MYLADEGAINPREIKLLINTYVLQLKVLWPRLGDQLDPDVVLALLCMNFRLDWRPFTTSSPPNLSSSSRSSGTRSGHPARAARCGYPVPHSLSHRHCCATSVTRPGRCSVLRTCGLTSGGPVNVVRRPLDHPGAGHGAPAAAVRRE